MRIIGAVLAGSAMSSLTINGALYLFIGVFAHQEPMVMVPSFLGFLLYAFISSAIVATTVGLGWHALAASRGWTDSFSYWIPATACGALIGLALCSILSSSFGLADPDAWTVFALVIAYATAMGGLTGFFAWLIRRPDRDTPRSSSRTREA